MIEVGQIEYDEWIEHIIRKLPFLITRSDKNIEIAEILADRPPVDVFGYLRGKNSSVDSKLFTCYRISGNVVVDSGELRNRNVRREITEDMLGWAASVRFGIAIEDYLFLSEIARPGAISTSDGVVIYKGVMIEQIENKTSFNHLLQKEHGKTILEWPKIKRLDAGMVYEWAEKVGYFRSEIAKNRCEKILAALSHVLKLHVYGGEEILFRCMQGLEGFYCDGTGDLRRQLSEKTRLFLGEWKGNKNIVGQLYDIRSKYIHGGGNLRYYGKGLECVVERDTASDKYEEALDFAERLLIGTIQKLVEEKIYSIKWSYGYEVNTG